MTDPVTDAVTGAVTGPVTDAVTGPVTDSATGSSAMTLYAMTALWNPFRKEPLTAEERGRRHGPARRAGPGLRTG
ncbi:hypothetical protein Pta02_49120 [Planobispora takensis]|uniref:Uncharacterized protein n=1 Tax=Planobispora takensis TaxID=1367882 RepID=A0A8J3WUG8_9ACTN|nr:hypothetical protein Pta02_49120 [Planobispora takensis]